MISFTRALFSWCYKNVSKLRGFLDSLNHDIFSPMLRDYSSYPDVWKINRPVRKSVLIAKLFEKTVLLQLNDYLQRNKVRTTTQSAYREGHSCETVLLYLIKNTQLYIYDGEISAFLKLDSSAAFDTTNHMILLGRLNRKIWVSIVPLRWITFFVFSWKHDVFS